ncbi:MAG: hypothetical protein ACLP4V_18600 [Methylocella sp.]
MSRSGARIETAGAWIAIKRAEHDPAYAKLLADCMSARYYG